MKNAFLLATFIILFSCRDNIPESSLVNDFKFNIQETKNIEELLGNKINTIQLQDTLESFVGNVNKIIKKNDVFYIMSDDRRILIFEKNGKFHSSLDKRGGGPGEYNMLSDFDMFDNDGVTEMWICDFDKIRKYTYSEDKWNCSENIQFDNAVSKFKIVDNRYLLVLTGQNEKSLTVTDLNGKKLTAFLKKEIPFIMFKPVQFPSVNTSYMFQLGVSNEVVLFNPDSQTFSHHRIVNEDFLTSKSLLFLFEKRGQEYLRELSRLKPVRGYRQINDNCWLDYIDYNENPVRYVASRQNGSWRKMKVDFDEYPALATIGMSDSPDSFILVEFPENDNQNIVLKEFLQ
jgi:hypothetical protein